MEREIIEQEIELRAETIIPFPKDKYYTKEEVDELLDDKADEEIVDEILIDINNIADEMSYLSKISETASQIELNISTSDYKMSATLKDKNGNTIYTSNVIDLPLESVVVSGRYDSQTKKVILTLQNGTEIEFSVADLISGLQEEITINNKLSSDLVDDTNKTNKFVTSAEKTTWNNKSDFSGNYNDLTNKPDLTVYEEKSNKVTTLSSTSTDMQYPSAKSVYDSQEAQNEAINQTNAEVERANMVYNALPKVSGEGTDLTLDGTAECPVYEVGLRPSALEQTSTTGKNLLPNNVSSQTINGITVKVNNDKSISLSGTATNNIYLYLAGTASTYPLSLTAGTYTLNSNSNTNNVWIRLVDSNSNIYDSVQSATTITLENTTTFNSYIRVNNGATINVTLYPQLESGSTTTTYEEYTGGQPSPSPEFPQDIHVVSGDNDVKISNKNLFDGELEIGIINGTTGQNVANNNYIRNKNYIPVEELTNYKFSSDNPNIANVLVYEYKDDYSYNMTANKNVNFTSYLTTNAETKYIRFRPSYQTNDKTIKFQMEKGTTATSYVEHKEQTYPISLGDLEYCKIGNYEDIFFKNVVGSTYYDSTLELNKWYLKKNVGKVVFDGSDDENWDNKNLTDENLLFTTTVLDSFVNRQEPENMLCNYFLYVRLLWDNDTEGYRLYNQYRSFRIRVNKSLLNDISTKENAINSFKTWLSTHNTTVYYVLATPTNILLNNTLQTQLDNLSNAISYQGQTNVSQVNDDLPFVIKMSAIRDLSGIFDLIQE